MLNPSWLNIRHLIRRLVLTIWVRLRIHIRTERYNISGWELGVSGLPVPDLLFGLSIYVHNSGDLVHCLARWIIRIRYWGLCWAETWYLGAMRIAACLNIVIWSQILVHRLSLGLGLLCVYSHWKLNWACSIHYDNRISILSSFYRKREKKKQSPCTIIYSWESQNVLASYFWLRSFSQTQHP